LRGDPIARMENRERFPDDSTLAASLNVRLRYAMRRDTGVNLTMNRGVLNS
jgi:hypothetical protein